ncbi:MerR family transcriptional regulator [Amycolatopsis sp. QT-25]|uniref:MerR family transcriptional regulator n=1 Tax=Amycolatopsis sp. QT-25 TaxID=3034022 RepID=UPI0023EC995D|nr:MerR family transcriptional regulator [Amycolatopsis sp. QT-25]WET78981.1 MerR family transcriptional regulator [Amycolatopsis sp. QT-25]
MTTDTILERLLASSGDHSVTMIDRLHELLDDSSLDTSATPVTVAKASKIIGLSPHTLRYYEREELVRPTRNSSGYRLYSVSDLRRLVFLARMRVSGMSMQDLKHYVALVEQGESTIPERSRMMLEQRDRIQRRLDELAVALEATEYKIRTYGGTAPKAP